MGLFNFRSKKTDETAPVTAETQPGFLARMRAKLNRGDSWLTYDLANLLPGGKIDETVLDELRPYLMADGGNVELVDIEGPIVKLRLQGACGSCPSSAMTLRMGIERKLREMIPEIAEIEQVI